MSVPAVGGRRLPIILLIDGSERMGGVFQVTLQQGIESLCQELRQNDVTARLVYLATIVCSSEGTVAQRLSAITRYAPPSWTAAGTLPLAEGLDQLSAILRFGLVTSKHTTLGDYTPIIIYALGASPLGDWQESLARVRALTAHPRPLRIALVTHPELETDARELADNVVLLQRAAQPGSQGTPDGAAVTAFFGWLTEAIQAIGASLARADTAIEWPALPPSLVRLATRN